MKIFGLRSLWIWIYFYFQSGRKQVQAGDRSVAAGGSTTEELATRIYALQDFSLDKRMGEMVKSIIPPL